MPASTRPRWPGRKPTASTAMPGRTLLVPGAGRRGRGRPVRPRQASTTAGRSTPARWPRRCPKATGISRRRRPIRPLPTLGVMLGGYVFTRYGKKPGKAIRLDRCRRAPTQPTCAALRERRHPRPRPDQHADQRHGPGRARDRPSAVAGAQAQGEGLGRSRATICWRRTFPMIHAVGRAADAGAAPDRHASGATATRRR